MSLRLRALARPSSILSTGPLTTNTRTTAGAIAATASRARFLSATPSPRGGGHDSHYDAPAGWLFGVKPGEKYEKEGWENVTYYAFLPLMVGFVGVYAFKPDTRYVLLCEEWVGGERGGGIGGKEEETGRGWGGSDELR